MVKRIAPAVCALMMLYGAGCSDSGESSSSRTVSEQQVTSSVSEADTSSEIRTYSYIKGAGEKLMAVYAVFASGSYTFECELTGTDVPEPIDITRIVNGSESYQLQQEKLGSHGTVSFSGKTYDFDYICGMYRESTEGPLRGIIEQIVEDKIPQTDAPAAGRDSSYDCEQYTYTGDTFITVIDFFFDKSDGHLVKYTMTYSVEGQDDIVETRTVLRLDSEADTSVFNAYFADTLVNFNSMSEPQKLGFCQGLCATWGITADEMFEMGVTSDSLGNIDYDTLFTLIHTYGKLRSGDADSSQEESSDESSDAGGSGDESGNDSSKDDTSSEIDSPEVETSSESEPVSSASENKE